MPSIKNLISLFSNNRWKMKGALIIKILITFTENVDYDSGVWHSAIVPGNKSLEDPKYNFLTLYKVSDMQNGTSMFWFKI